MSTVLWSTWTSTPPRMDGTILEDEWRGAERLVLPGSPEGLVHIQNDAQYLYLAIDLPEDTEAETDTGDYFWLTVDVDQDGEITPELDVNYSSARGEPDRLTHQLYLGPNSWTGQLDEPTDSMCTRGFGPTSLAAQPHTTWTMRLDLGELEATAGGVVFFGLRVASTRPAFVYAVPERFEFDFSTLVKLHIAERPRIPLELAGDVLAGVGLIPATEIVEGYGTTHAGYRLVVTDSAFGGVLDLIGNGDTLARLWAAGARRYRIQHQYAGTGFAPLDETWLNYRLLDRRRSERRVFAPDAQHTYPLTDPTEEYATEDLLVQWTSTDAPAGLHDFYAEFFAADGSPVGTGSDQTLQLMIDNGQPAVRVDSIRDPRDNELRACDFARLEKGEAIDVVVTATDARGHLQSWELAAEYGESGRQVVGGGSYPAAPPPGRHWPGVTRARVQFVPPVSCAYLFRVSAAKRVTNGYTAPIGGAQAYRTVTLVAA